jgi:aminopeptidase N
MRQAGQIAAAILLLTMCAAGIGQSRERERTYDVLHYGLDLLIDEREKEVEGTVTIRLVPLTRFSSFQLDAGPMEIRGIRRLRSGLPPVALRHTLRGNALHIYLPQQLTTNDTLSVAIRYACKPAAGMYFVQPDDEYPLKPLQVWTQGEEEMNHFWFPCYDYPNDMASVDLRVTVNENHLAISNGALVEETHDTTRHTRTFVWYSPKPFSSYLISLVVGRYAKIEEWYKNIPVQYYVYLEQKEHAMRSFGKTVDMMRFYAEQIGVDYPWQKYAQVVVSDFMYGGMENVSATTLTDKTIHSARAQLDQSSDGLVAHELAHQWFGDLLTCRSWAHAWLNEGFATYCASLYTERTKGWDEFQYDMLQKQEDLVGSDTGGARRPTVWDKYTQPSELFNNHIYGRGACILHMLRFVLGDDLFWKGIHRYVSVHQHENVVTEDFQRALEQVSREPLDWFFDQWVAKAGYPVLEVASSFDARAKSVTLRVVQAQTVDSLTPLYRMPIEVGVVTGSGTRVHRLMLEARREQTVRIPVDGKPLNVVLDPGGWLLTKVHHTKSRTELIYQLQQGNVAARVGALQDLASQVDTPDVHAELVRVLHADPFWGVRRKAAEVLGSSSDSTVIADLAPAFKDPDPKVRLAATQSLRHFKRLDALIALGNIADSDSSYAVVAEAIAALVAIDSANGMKYCEKGLSLDSDKEVIRAAAVAALGTLRTEDARRRLMDLTGYGHPKEVRLASMDALVTHWKSDGRVRKRLEDLVHDPMHGVQWKAVEQLGSIASPKSRRLLIEFSAEQADEQLRREARKALANINRALRH